MERREFLKTMTGGTLVGVDLINRPYQLLLPSIQTQESQATPERTWSTFAQDLSALKSEIGISIPAANISVEGLNGFDNETKELVRRLQLKTAERTSEAYKNVVDQGFFTEEEVQSIFLKPLEGLALRRNENLLDGASTNVTIGNEGYVVSSNFGVLLPDYLLNIGNESLHQEIAPETIVGKYPSYQKPIIEALSFLAEWDLIRTTRIGSPDLYVELPLETLRETLRSLRTEYFLPYEKTPDYYNMVRAFGPLLDLVGRDGALLSFSESVATTIASPIIHKNLRPLKEEVISYLAEELTGKYTNSQVATTVKEVLPDGEGTMIPEGVTQVLALDHLFPPSEQKGIDNEPGFLASGITFSREGTSISAIPVGKVVKAEVSSGIKLDFSKIYTVGLEGTAHSGLFIPLSSFSQSEIPNGTVISLVINTGSYLKYHNLVWNFEGTSPAMQSASQDEALKQLCNL